MMKQFILYTIFCNVLTLPWGLSHRGLSLGVLGSVTALLVKFALVATVVVVVETVQSRLRFYRYQEPLAASFLLTVLAIITNQLGLANVTA
jgi:formate hydrogenlyase subunit 4